MTYVKRKILRRVLPVVTTFVLISFLISGKVACARSQKNSSFATSPNTKSDNDYVVSNSNNSEIKELVPGRPDQFNEAMYSFLERHRSTLIWSLLDSEFLKELANCVPALMPSHLLMPAKNFKRVLLYLKKIKTKIKDHPAIEALENDLRVAFQHIRSKNTLIGNHFKFLVLILFLRLLVILKSCRQGSSFKSIHNQNPSLRKAVQCASKYDPDVVLYLERIIHIYVRSFSRMFRQHSHCDQQQRLFQVLDNSDSGASYRAKRSLRDDRSFIGDEFSVKSQPYSVEQEDNYRENLIANFVANSLPDLKMPPPSLAESQKTLFASASRPYLVVEQPYSEPEPEPEPKPVLHISSSSNLGDWSIQSTTDLYPVPLITIKPTTNQQPPFQHHVFTESSHIQWRPPTTASPLDTNGAQWSTSTSIYHKPAAAAAPSNDGWYSVHNYPSLKPVAPLPVEEDDIFLHFPYPIPQPPLNSTISRPSYNEPFFVEPIVVSSVDQLPTNYPIPMENASLSHNPVTVMIGSKPPEIVVLENFQSVVTIEEDAVPPSAGASADGAPVPAAVEEDPAAGAAAAPAGAAPAAGAAAAAAAAAAAGLGGLGALGALGAGAGIVGGAVAGGIGAGVGASAAGGAGADGTAEATAGVGVSMAPTDVMAYSPNADADDSELETVYGDFYDFVVWVLSLGFFRPLLKALYSLIFPHISLLITSGFTMVAFLFPWLYPHIVVPVVSFLTSFTV